MRLSKGWTAIPGVQDGDRTIEEQMFAVRPALSECKGKTVLDLGCAEGVIANEFYRAGATVFGLDSNKRFLEVAERFKADRLDFHYADLNAVNQEEPVSFDIVLCLGIIQKLTWPGNGLRWAARSAKELLLLRCGNASKNGIVTGKRSGNSCDSAKIMTEEGFILERTENGTESRNEPVEYWRRK